MYAELSRYLYQITRHMQANSKSYHMSPPSAPEYLGRKLFLSRPQRHHILYLGHKARPFKKAEVQDTSGASLIT